MVVSSDSFTDQTNWEYRIGNYLVPLTVVGLTSAYQNTTYGSVIYTWTEAQINNAYYVRYRSYYDAGIAGYQYSPYKIEKVIL